MAPAFSWFLAWRYLVARRIVLLGILGVAVAVWAPILVNAVFSGFVSEIRAGVRLASPELLLTDLPAEADFAKLAPTLRGVDGVAAIAPRVQHDVLMLAYGHHARYSANTRPIEVSQVSRGFVRLLGVDFAAERQATSMSLWVERTSPDLRVTDVGQPFVVSPELAAQGRRDVGENPRQQLLALPDGLLLSERRLTRGEPIALGSRIDIVSARFVAAGDDELKVATGRHVTALCGAFVSGHRSHDELTVLADIEFVRRLLGFAADESEVELVTQVAIKVAPGADPLAVAQRVVAAVQPLRGETEPRVLTWEEQNSVYLSAVEQERMLMKVCTFTIMLVAGFLIYATLHMMVMQKVRDIGVLTAMGATPWGVQTIFVVAGLTIAVIGATLGVGIGIVSAIYLNPVLDAMGLELFPRDVYALERVPYELDNSWVLQVVVAAIGLSLLVAWLPARRAARLHPVTALAKT